MKHLTMNELEAGLDEIRRSPKDGGVLEMIVRRPAVQIGLGIGAGGCLVWLIFVGLFETTPTPFEAAMMAGYAMLMIAVCFSACLVPLRRALRLQPSQVLRSEA